MGFRVINGKIVSVQDFTTSKVVEKKQTAEGSKFDQLLQKEINKKEGFVISNHAADRLKDRNIVLHEKDMKKINEAIDKAQDKGAREALILYKDIALVTSIRNRTVITALDKNNNEGAVVTNIDSVVLL